MTRPVSLAMYQPGGLATARFWDGLRGHLEAGGVGDLPAVLEIPSNYEAFWRQPDLLLSQTCGYPLRTALAGKVQYVGTPVYDADGTDGANYRSAIVLRADDEATDIAELRGRRAAYNSVNSQSGYNAFRDLVAPLARDGRFFSDTIATGSHAASLRAVIDGRADVAAIDAISLALEDDAVRAKIKIIGWTAPAPGLPYITGPNTDAIEIGRLRQGIADALDDDDITEPRRALRLTGFEILPNDAYDAILAMQQRAIDRGYPVLA